MNEINIRLAGITTDSIVDGPGIRVVIFAQGCPHACEGCQNPQTHAFEAGVTWSVKQILEKIHQNPLAKGVTFSGGEPFCQAQAFLYLAKVLKQEGYEIACYTGYCFEELLQGEPAQQELLKYLDILIDGRFILSQKNLELRFRGSSNQRILDLPQSLQKQTAIWCTQERWIGCK